MIVGYCDLRAATKAHRSIKHKRFFNDRLLDADYVDHAVLTKLAAEGADMFLGPNTGELSVTLTGRGGLSQQQMYLLLSSYGDLRSFRAIENDVEQVWICDFYHIGNAAAALQLNGREVGSVYLTVSFYNSEKPKRDFFPNAASSLLSHSKAIERLSFYSQRARSDFRSFEQPHQLTPKKQHLLPKINSPSAAYDVTRVQKSPSFRSFEDEERVRLAQVIDNGRRASAVDVCSDPNDQSFRDLFKEKIAVARIASVDLGHYSSALPTPEDRPSMLDSYFTTPLQKCKTSEDADGISPLSEFKSRHAVRTSTPLTTPFESPESYIRSDLHAERARGSVPPPPKLSRSITYDAFTKPDYVWKKIEKTTPVSTSHGLLSPPRSPYSTDPKNKVEFGAIARGKDDRTTLMIKNIPNKISQKQLKTWVDQTSEGCYGFLYLRMDFASRANVGYAFIDFNCPTNIIAFAQARVGTAWNVFGSEKICDVSYANIQGKEALVEKFRNSCVMDELEEYRPRIYHSSGPLKGLEQAFPEPNNLNRKARSIRDAQQIGLFPPSTPSSSRLDTPVKDSLVSPLSRSSSLLQSTPIRSNTSRLAMKRNSSFDNRI